MCVGRVVVLLSSSAGLSPRLWILGLSKGVHWCGLKLLLFVYVVCWHLNSCTPFETAKD